ncbi:imelysin family protein [Vreelandella neptunia]|uniref:Imelysin family protein n=1 Tax=Vreelandella neptunia TaxID=115551 RepID=A0ABZ0YR51_9GAMM|nr:imelysin family protein [Halomonas neptunia]MDN3558748.1 imelysin family protein [Halomonas neptunia]TDV92726.1 putative iron-regulated protein [Halomonas alkaliantarctica]WQH13715.1 imelysin family protein [Halomonas neptunia]
MPAIMLRRPLAGIVALSALMPFAPVAVDTAAADGTVSADAVVKHYADLAHANYADALNAAQALNERIDELLANPTAETLSAAKQAWLQARVPYQQSEVFRFGNAVVDDWEGQLNAWPLDEGMIDYVEGDDYQHELGNEGATANIIANEQISVGGESLDVSDITPELLADLNEIGGSEANVASGYHAIEFLLWGQDLHGFEEGNGERPVSDYQTGDDCTHGHCDRRRSYLDAVSDLLVDDLEWMVTQWAPETEGNYRQELLAESDQEGLRRMLFGMGSLSLGELAGERLKVALEANSFEDEHDCFSDNTHNSHYYNGQGVQNIYTGSYQRLDGSVVEGPSLQDLLSQADSELADTLGEQLEATMTRLDAIKQAAEAESSPMAFDMMIAPGNEQGSELINEAILTLVAQTGSIEQAAGELGVTSLQPDDAGHRF